jgi:hypothetical protein
MSIPDREGETMNRLLRRGVPRRAALGVVLASAVLGGLVLAGGRPVGASPSAESATPTAEGRALVQRYFVLLKRGDRSGLNALLAPNFQVVRANGGVQNKASYLANPPKVDRYTITNVVGTRYPGVLVVTYRLTVIETIDGVEQPTGPAPRLSVFHRQNGRWRLVAHANFGAIRT